MGEAAAAGSSPAVVDWPKQLAPDRHRQPIAACPVHSCPVCGFQKPSSPHLTPHTLHLTPYTSLLSLPCEIQRQRPPRPDLPVQLPPNVVTHRQPPPSRLGNLQFTSSTRPTAAKKPPPRKHSNLCGSGGVVSGQFGGVARQQQLRWPSCNCSSTTSCNFPIPDFRLSTTNTFSADDDDDDKLKLPKSTVVLSLPPRIQSPRSSRSP